jgi:branched-chain amino acid transport system permease protein
MSQLAESVDTSVPTVGTSLSGWLGHIGDVVAELPGGYRSRLRRKRRQTIIVTIVALLGLSYPVIHQYVLAGFSRNVFPLPLPDDTVMTFMMIFSIMAVGLNIVAGFAGLLDLGYVAFYAIGAYVAAFLASPHWAAFGINIQFLSLHGANQSGIHLPFWIVVPIAVIIVATFGALLGAPTLRLRGDYLAIVTLGFGEIVPLVFKNLSNVTWSMALGPINIHLVGANLTGGVQGINPVDPPFLPFLNVVFDARAGFLPVYLGIILMLLAVLVARNLQYSRIGRAWIAIREDETAAEMMGVNTVRTKLLAFALGASFAGIAGALQASYLGATTSDFFDFNISILVLIMIILGGIGNIWGVVVGALTLQYVDRTFLPFLSQQIQAVNPALPNLAQYNFLIFGIILLFMMRFRPQGFIPSRQREAELAVMGMSAAEAEMGIPIDEETGQAIDVENIEVAPPGQDETGPDARAPEVPGEGRDL